MTKTEMGTQFAILLDRMRMIMEAKNSDYSGDIEDPFLNFNQVELISKGEISRDQGCLVRMTDKLSRTYRLLKNNPSVKTETLEDTLIDLANYSLLLILMRRDRANAENNSTAEADNHPAVNPLRKTDDRFESR